MLGNEGMIRRASPFYVGDNNVIYSRSGAIIAGGDLMRLDYFEFDVNNTQVISGLFSTISSDDYISVDWGDGSARDMYSGTDQAWSHDYGSAVDATVRIFGSVVLTKFKMDASGADISFDIANLPSGLTDCIVEGSNTISGDIVNLPSGLKYLRVYGSNTISGDIVNLPSGLIYLRIYGNNTITGDIVNLPSGLTDFYITGNNTIADYTSKTWTTKPSIFGLVPVSPGGLSTAEVDQLLIDLDDDLTWSSGDVINLTGSNEARSSASDAAVNNMTAEGATITTN